jgi:hypothetical protein
LDDGQPFKPGLLVSSTEMADETVKTKNSWFWPKVDSPELAHEAARNGGVSFGFIALGYFVVLIFLYVGTNTPVTPTSRDPLEISSVMGVDAVILALAIYLCWRSYRRPTLVLCAIALAWSLLEFAGKASRMGIGSGNILGMYWGQILGTLCGISGVRGALASKRFKRANPSE